MSETVDVPRELLERLVELLPDFDVQWPKERQDLWHEWFGKIWAAEHNRVTQSPPAPATETPTPRTDVLFDRILDALQDHFCGKIYSDDLLAYLKQSREECRQLERELADARAAKPTKWGWWATLEFDIEDPQCVACGVTMQLNEGCEWPDFSELCLCGSCATKVLEELRPLTLPAGPDGGEG